MTHSDTDGPPEGVAAMLAAMPPLVEENALVIGPLDSAAIVDLIENAGLALDEQEVSDPGSVEDRLRIKRLYWGYPSATDVAEHIAEKMRRLDKQNAPTTGRCVRLPAHWRDAIDFRYDEEDDND